MQVLNLAVYPFELLLIVVLFAFIFLVIGIVRNIPLLSVLSALLFFIASYMSPLTFYYADQIYIMPHMAVFQLIFSALFVLSAAVSLIQFIDVVRSL